SLSRMKGIDIIYAAWNRLREDHPDARLVLAGSADTQVPVDLDASVIYLGQLDERGVSRLFQALDVGIVSIADSQFGRYCFPQKFYEMLASNLPIVASNVGAMPELLKDHPNLLFDADEPESLVQALERQLVSRNVP